MFSTNSTVMPTKRDYIYRQRLMFSTIQEAIPFQYSTYLKMDLAVLEIFIVLLRKTQTRKVGGWRVMLVLGPQISAANLVPNLYFLKWCCV